MNEETRQEVLQSLARAKELCDETIETCDRLLVMLKDHHNYPLPEDG